MGILKSLFTPQIPSLSDIVGVVEWMFRHDETIADVSKVVPAQHLSKLKQTIIQNLSDSSDADQLQEHIEDACSIHQEALEVKVKFHRDNSSIEPNAIVQAVVFEKCGIAMLRIYGYYMRNKFHREPEVGVRTPEQRPSGGPTEKELRDTCVGHFSKLLASSREVDCLLGVLLPVRADSEGEWARWKKLSDDMGIDFIECLFLRFIVIDFALFNVFHGCDRLGDLRDLHSALWKTIWTDRQHEMKAERMSFYGEAIKKKREDQSYAQVLASTFVRTTTGEPHAAFMLQAGGYTHATMVGTIELLQEIVKDIGKGQNPNAYLNSIMGFGEQPNRKQV